MYSYRKLVEFFLTSLEYDESKAQFCTALEIELVTSESFLTIDKENYSLQASVTKSQVSFYSSGSFLRLSGLDTMQVIEIPIIVSLFEPLIQNTAP